MHDIHPTLRHEIARYRQADILRESERARLAHELSLEDDRPRRRLRLRRRERSAFKPAFR
jgi:hypothetical protein